MPSHFGNSNIKDIDTNQFDGAALHYPGSFFASETLQKKLIEMPTHFGDIRVITCT